jgi:6,7-dimethyl-8-ribityllumazine synthase
VNKIENRMDQAFEAKTGLPGTGLKMGIVCARFNEQACTELLTACLDELQRLGVAYEDLTVVRVPGALEIPLVLQTLAQTNQVDALIALGAVIRGETYHFELVSNEAGAGVSQVQLDTGIPIANGILTTENDAQTHARTHDKGRDCAQAAVEMALTLTAIRAGL